MPGIVHGAAVTAFGWLLLWLAGDRFWLLSGAFSGFMIVAPILSTGLYLVSQRNAKGETATMGDIAALWRSMDGRLVVFGLMLALAATGWVMTSAALVTSLMPGAVKTPTDFLRLVVLSETSWVFETWLFVGGVLAAPMFASSVIAIPMLVDTRATIRDAIRASWNAVGTYPVQLALWALLIMVVTGLGMLAGLVGLVIAVPVLAHASWHAYVALKHCS